MVKCSIIVCGSDSKMKIKGISFHSFPKDKAYLKIWIAATGREDWEPGKSSKICTIHFNKSFVAKVKGKTFLHDGAIPTKIPLKMSSKPTVIKIFLSSIDPKDATRIIVGLDRPLGAGVHLAAARVQSASNIRRRSTSTRPKSPVPPGLTLRRRILSLCRLPLAENDVSDISMMVAIMAALRTGNFKPVFNGFLRYFFM